MVEKGITEGICHAIHQYVKANNKYMKDCDKNKKLLIFLKIIFSLKIFLIYMVGKCCKSFQ